GDIHINGLEGPYTFVLIDGMPIVSGLSTVYGLSGIPNSLIEKVEIVKGPASSLYGSEAVGGLINIITKNPLYASKYAVDVFGTSWGEINTDLGLSLKVSDKVHWLMGVNYFNYSNPIDKNKDGFTDVTLQDRISIFNKLTFERKSKKQLALATRYFYEDRWGGQMNWNRNFRGGTDVYGESIYTNRWELLGLYELPFTEKITSQFSITTHDQNSMYGDTPFMAKQNIAFTQFYWDKTYGKHDLLVGTAAR
ncbi:MAG: TonB-dependent receptor plug domain-containing protein, partial [Myroides sp.]